MKSSPKYPFVVNTVKIFEKLNVGDRRGYYSKSISIVIDMIKFFKVDLELASYPLDIISCDFFLLWK